jgi:hypothetical protein
VDLLYRVKIHYCLSTEDEESKGSKDAPVDEDSDDEGDLLQAFPKKIYKDANPDTTQAMMKSSLESKWDSNEHELG